LFFEYGKTVKRLIGLWPRVRPEVSLFCATNIGPMHGVLVAWVVLQDAPDTKRVLFRGGAFS
jgi:hypothetical protein